MSNINDFEIQDGVLIYYNGSDIVVDIPDGVLSIGDHAFDNCSSMESVVIPDSVTSIGIGAFSRCNNLTIFVPSVSTAEEFAVKENIPFVAL